VGDDLPALRDEVRSMGRVTPVLIPAIEVAVIAHPGTHADINRAYGASSRMPPLLRRRPRRLGDWPTP
jgi:hypothetical protein